jgi:hypothetical protein
MAWDSTYSSFGLVKVDGKRVLIYKDRTSYNTLNVGEPVVSAVWAGGELNVSLASGKVRRYSNAFTYTTI